MARFPCPSDQALRAFHLGQLPEPSLNEITEHLEHCPRCEARMQRLDRLSDPLLAAILDPTQVIQKPVGRGRAGPATSLPKLRHYEILGTLGRGGMAIVFKARQLGLNRLVALKMIRGGEHCSAEVLARFRNEAEAAARLHHPNLVQIYEIGQQGGELFLALEYVEGTNLDEYLAGQPQPPRRAAELIETLARTMHYAHERGIIHRDLKPSNVLLQRKAQAQKATFENQDSKQETEDKDSSNVEFRLSDFDLKVTDFGLAKQLDRHLNLTQTGTVAGTPAYMAPEQALGDTTRPGPALDIFSLGVMLYEMLTGHVPFQGATAVDTLRLLQGQEPVPPRQLQPGLPRDLQTICLKCLEKEPDRRYPTAAALADDLRRFLQGEPIVARPVSAGARAWRRARRHPLVTGLVVGLILTGLAGLGGVLGQWRAAVQERQRAEASATDALTARDHAEEALRLLRREQRIKLERGQRSAPLFLRDAKLSAEQNDLDYALAQASVALEYDPELAEGRLVRAQVLIVKRDMLAARQELESYLRQRPQDQDAARLLELCQTFRPGSPTSPAAFADVLVRQGAYGLAAQLEQDRSKLVEIVKKRIAATWPGMPYSVRMEGLKLAVDLTRNTLVSDLALLKGLPIDILVLNGCAEVRDLAPLQALPLSELAIANTKVRDLAPLRGMHLTSLHAGFTEVEDLAPLRGLPLSRLCLHFTKVHDLTPLQGLPLTVLDLFNCRGVRDLTPLRHLPLTTLNLGETGVRDLTPLRGMPLTSISLIGWGRPQDLEFVRTLPLRELQLARCALITDVTPLEGMKLEVLELPPQVLRGMDVVRRMPTLKIINTRPAADFWKDYDAGGQGPAAK